MASRTTSGEGAARRASGFTLIELLVVFAILATLLTLAVPRYFSSVDRSKEAVLKQNLATLRNSLDQFHSDTGKYPESLDDLVKKRYLRSVPLDPITERIDSWVPQPPPADSGSSGIYDVRSGAEGKATDGSDYASW
jgi:general secretion pathway protein G